METQSRLNVFLLIEQEKQEKRDKLKTRQSRPTKDLISDEDFDNFMVSLKKDPRFEAKRAQLCFLILFVTGLRIQELSFLRYKDIKSLWAQRGG